MVITEKRRMVLAVLVAVAFAGVFGCGGGAARSPRVLFGTPEGIVDRSLEDGDRSVLVPAAGLTTTLRDPAVSPDGSRLAFVQAPPLRRVNGVTDGGSDLWVASRDGTGARMLYEHGRLTEAVFAPQWRDDETIYAIVRFVKDPATPGSGSEWYLASFDAETGERRDVVSGALSFGLSPKRDRIAYVHLESMQEQPLFTAGIDGGDAIRLLDSTSGLEGVVSPLFTPDGSMLLFAAHKKATAARPTEPLVTARPFGKSVATLHSAPTDLWRIEASGGTPTLAATMGLLEPGLSLDEDGETVFALSDDLYQVDLASGQMTVVESPSSFGRPSWEPR
jgi:Tol biopolymer transport system component